jgi:2-iminobutanoate/2-iminopropanoate deaminase
VIRRWAVVVAAGLAFTTGVWSMQQRRVVQDGSAQASQAVVAGGFVFISALLAADDGGRIAEGDIATQTRLVLERLRAVLREAGSSLGQVVTVHVYLRQASDFDAMNTVYREFFTEAPPTRTTVVAGLAQGALVAMSAVAVPEGAHRETLHPAGWVKSPPPSCAPGISCFCRAS